MTDWPGSELWIFTGRLFTACAAFLRSTQTMRVTLLKTSFVQHSETSRVFVATGLAIVFGLGY